MTETIPFGKFLEDNNCSLLVSTYKSNLMLALTASEGEAVTTAWPMARPMGITRFGDRLAIGTETVVVQYTNQPALAQQLNVHKSTDALFMKRSLHITGDINIHDLGYGTSASGETELWFVNTKFSCLSTLKEGFSFIPRWKPEWVSALVGEDRCHLNGMEMVKGKPKYVSAFSQTDSQQGWREQKKNVGVVFDIEQNKVVAEGIYHPHSPSFYKENLYVLESGTGSICRVNLETGEVNRLSALSGYVRGLGFVNNFAIIGLSKIRETNTSKVKLADPADSRAGIGVVDLTTGEIVSTLRFDEAVSEIYDIEVLEGIKWPSFAEHNAASQSEFVIPGRFEAAFKPNTLGSKP